MALKLYMDHHVPRAITAALRQRAGIPFAGLIYAHQLRVSIRECVTDLEVIAGAGEPEELLGQVIFLPL
jgi:hypothetical protein